MEKGEGNKEKWCLLRDSADKFMKEDRKRNHELNEHVEEGGDDEELSLGLSLNGKFGVDPKKQKILNRSSSVTRFVVPGDKKMENEFQYSIIRTSSLPMKTEEEWRKREEEAENNKWEKMKKIIVVKENDEENVNFSINVEAFGKSLKSSRGLLGRGSSGVAELESKQPLQGLSSSTDVRPLVSGRSLEREQKLVAIALETANEKPPALAGKSCKETKEKLRNLMHKMPWVSTRGGRPYGKEVEGFLYAYKKGEEVKIVCVCHGSFLTPAEFVRHAGGGDVANPLRHIVIHRVPL
ncbi:unnamed protein product [Withania somnifera]